MTTSITTLKGLVAASAAVVLVACGSTPDTEVTHLDAGEPTDSQPASPEESPEEESPEEANDPVPWSQLPDGDRPSRTHSNPAGCDSVDTLLPC